MLAMSKDIDIRVEYAYDLMQSNLSFGRKVVLENKEQPERRRLNTVPENVTK